MTQSTRAGFASLSDPCWTASDYQRFADHGSPEVCRWALARLRELGLEIPEGTLRRLLDDADVILAVEAAHLAGRQGTPALADVLLARLKQVEDAVGLACARSLAKLGDRRVIAAIGRRGHLNPEKREPEIWVALWGFKDREAAGILWEAFRKLPPPGEATCAFELCTGLMRADPEAGIPQVLERWLKGDDEIEGDELLDSLLYLVGYRNSPDDLRWEMDAEKEEIGTWLPEDILDRLAEGLPLGPIRQAFEACRECRWGDALEPLLRLIHVLADRAPAAAGIALPLTLVRALEDRAEELDMAGEDKIRDAAGLLFVALDGMAQEVREASLRLPNTLEEQVHWLLSDAACAFPDAQVRVLARVAEAGPSDLEEKACIRAIERRSLQAPVAARLLAARRSEAAVPMLVGVLGAREGDALAAAAVEVLVAIGEAALDAVLVRLDSAEDPVLLQECFAVCTRLPSRRAVEAICRRFEDLFILAPESLMNTIHAIGAREFLEPLGRELREGEAQAERTFALLCALHGVDDPRLPAIREREAERLRRLTQPPGDRGLDLALQCNGCRRTYTYPVRAIFVDPETPKEEGVQPFIRDRIRCKGCGREDDYTLAPRGQFTVRAQLAALLNQIKQFGPVPEEGPLYLRPMALPGGRRMNPREARRDYEERLTRRPDDPGLHIAYGDALQFLGELEKAEGAYRRALELDPQAIEASAGLAQVAAERGDMATARSAYRAALALGGAARVYNVADRQEFLKGLEQALRDIQGRLAIRAPDPAAARASLDGRAGHDRPGPRVSRNAPCPCGSGKKYKKCCLPKDEAPTRESRRGREGPDGRLLDRLVSYVPRSLSRAELHRAAHEFFGEPLDLAVEALRRGTDEAEDEWSLFQHWCIYDFRLSTGQTLIAQFLAERGPSLPPDERAILEEWQDTAICLYEVLDLEPGKSLTLRDVFSGEIHRVGNVRGSLSAARWDLMAARLLRVRGEPQLEAVASFFSAHAREELVRHVSEWYEAYRRQHPRASWPDFFRAEPLIFRRYAEIMMRQDRLREVYTAEGHPLMLGRARYDVRDYRRLVAALSGAPDFVEEVPPDDPPGQRHFTWLRTGPAEGWVQEAAGSPDGLVISSQRIEDPAEEGIPSLASLRLARDRLTIEATSAERLAWAKGRLAGLAGDAVSLRSDVVEPWPKARDGAGRRGPEERRAAVDPEVEAQIAGQLLHRHYTTWLDQAVPALGGQTPRDAARDPGQRPKVIQLLREIENQQGHARQQGKVWYDVGWIWEELGISRQEA